MIDIVEVPIEVALVNENGDAIRFKVKKSTKFSKIMEAYAKQNNEFDIDTATFTLPNGLKISYKNPNGSVITETLKMLELKDNDEIHLSLNDVVKSIPAASENYGILFFFFFFT